MRLPVALVLLLACDPPPVDPGGPYAPCFPDSSCLDELECSLGVCAPACSSAGSCPLGAPDVVWLGREVACFDEGQCFVACDAAHPCRDEQECVEGRCLWKWNE